MPGALAEPEEEAGRRSVLDQGHMRALAHYVRALNGRGLGWAPDFDPLDGGAAARLLLLLEKPGPGLHTGFVSRDNDTPTAAAIRAAMAQAGVQREGTVIWNAVPWWNGTTAIRAAERQAGLAALTTLLRLLPGLRAAVLAGRTAQGARTLFCTAGVPVFDCVHPSPNARAGPASSVAWMLLPQIWRTAWDAAAECRHSTVKATSTA